jgi:hypothetical protein
MAVIRDLNTIIQNHIDYLRANQPDADIKPGTVIRDLFIDLPSTQIAGIYSQLGTVGNKYSVRNYFGKDLEDYIKPYGIIRRSAQPSSGLVVLTFSSITSTIAITSGTTLTASNGVGFTVSSTKYIDSNSANYYKAIAQKYANDLNYIGITDQYAIEVSVTANTSGTVGSISKYTLNKANLTGINNVFNPVSFTGIDSESDTDLQNRFINNRGSVAGTSLGLYNTVISVSKIQDAYIAEAGDPLMTRDGTVVDSSGNIVSEGSGGKIDIIVLGIDSKQAFDTFVYKDKSNKNDPTDSKNDYILGQIPGDANKTLITKRRDDLKLGVLPTQPVQNITLVSGSSSGYNYLEKTTDQYGKVSGNYELVKDTSDYAGSPWGFDTFKWISNYVNINEDHNKGIYNGQDKLSFSDVIEIPTIKQNIPVSNENSTILTDNSTIQLLHYPISVVTRVLNATTGERYRVSNLNLVNGLNQNGIIQISGNTLPAPSDILQVDYNWVVTYDNTNDYDGKISTNNIRSVSDSIDWGYSNKVKEFISFTANAGVGTGLASHIINKLSSINSYTIYKAIPKHIYSGYLNRYQIQLSLSSQPNFPVSVKITNSNIELFNLSNKDYFVSFSGTVWTITLPSDANQYLDNHANVSVDIYTNPTDLSTNASIKNNQITIPLSVNSVLEVNYFCDSQTIVKTNPTSMNCIRNGNGLIKNYNLPSSVVLQSDYNNVYRSVINTEFQTVKVDVSSNKYINLYPTAGSPVDYTIESIISCIRISDGVDLYLSSQPVTIDSSGKYKLILNTSSVLSDIICVTYTVVSNTTIQPLTESVSIISKRNIIIPTSTTLTSINIFEAVTETVAAVLFNATLNTYTNISGSITPGNGYADYSASVSFTPNCYYQLIITSAINPQNNGIFSIDIINSSSSIRYSIPNLQFVLDKEIFLLNSNTGGLVPFTRSGNTLTLNVSATSSNLYLQMLVLNCNNLRNSNVGLSLNTNDTTNQTGTIKVSGITLNKFTHSFASSSNVDTTSSNNAINLQAALLAALNYYGYTNYANDLSGNNQLSSQYGIAKITQINQVDVVQSTQEIIKTNVRFTLNQYKLKTNTFDDLNVIEDSTLNNYQVRLPSSITNDSNIIYIGQTLSVSFYFYIIGDSEITSFTKNGTLYTNKKFITIDSIKTISGFNKSNSTSLLVSNISQPSQNVRYTSNYSYTAPKQNERISITYNYNSAITQATLALEASRISNQDILAKAATTISIDITIYIVILQSYITSQNTIVQNVYNAITSSSTLTSLESILDASDVINSAASIVGVDRVRLTQFNISGQFGLVNSIVSKNNQYIIPGTVIVNLETR